MAVENPNSEQLLNELAPPSVDGLAVDLARRRLRAALLGESLEPTRVGRFVLEQHLGQGGMGTVWRAHDEQLGRPVALKFLRKTDAGEAAEARLLREAQGLAKLAHPNVVPVFDSGRHEGRVWIAMELVRGRTLREWIEQDQPSAGARLGAWLAAGRGLAAVHAAGLVHRDVKPDNVMIDDEGHVRLVDFGLVGGADGLESRTSWVSATGSGDTDGGSTNLTATRQFVGTPAYAAPEQRRGERADARSDQYALCVSLWEALCGSRPSADPRTRPSGLSRRVYAALRRGLAADPSARFADMQGLLAALEPSAGRWAFPVFLAAAIASAGLALALDDSEAAVDPCARAGDPIAAIWAPQRRAGLDAAFGPSGGARGAELIDGWTRAWAEASRRSCEEVHVEHRRSSEVLDRRSACLERAGAELDAILLAVESGELDELGQLARGLDALIDPQLCLSSAVADAQLPAIPAGSVDEVRDARQELFQARHGVTGASLAERRGLVESVEARARAIGWRPLEAEAAAVRGRLELLAGAAPLARDRFGVAMDLALELDDRTLLLDARRGLIDVAVMLELDADAAQWGLARLEALSADAGPSDRALGLERRGHVEVLRGRLEQAERSFRGAREAWREAGPSHLWAQATALRLIANVAEQRGRAKEALALVAEARSLEQLGSGEERGGMERRDQLLHEGIAALDAGEFARARASLDEALALAIASEGARGLTVVTVEIARAGLFDALGDLPAAREAAAHAEQICATTLGPEHPERVNALSAVALVAYRAEEFELAAASYQRVLKIAARQLPPTSMELALHWLNYGDALTQLEGRELEAEDALARARTMLEAELPPDHPYLAVALKSLGALALRRGQLERALELLGRAAAIHAQTAVNLVEGAEVQWLLARAHARAGGEAEARAAAESAADGFAALGPDWAGREAEIRAWLRTFHSRH